MRKKCERLANGLNHSTILQNILAKLIKIQKNAATKHFAMDSDALTARPVSGPQACHPLLQTAFRVGMP